jgi:hypothetical protein
MNDRELDDILKQTANARPDVDSALLDRISASIGANLHSVQTLPPAWQLTSALLAIAIAIATLGALVLGPHGFQKMSALEIGLILPVLVILISLAAMLCVTEAIPGSRRSIAPPLLSLSCCLVLVGLFASLFHDYGTERFVAQGVKCLAAGLGFAIPASLAASWLLRRGFSVNAGAAGMARGTLAGLTGVAMLELHCPNLEAPHSIVWHVAVIAISAVTGLLLARVRKPTS